MPRSLFLLLLMGECSFCLGPLYKYRFVKENKTWVEAQKYCREKHTDLATLYDKEDMKRLVEDMKHHNDSVQRPWIGLRNLPHAESNKNKQWQWSLPGEMFNETNWDRNQPNPRGIENCVGIRRPSGKWHDFPCEDTYPFICYDETKPEPFHLINMEKTWFDAQSYCKEKHTDLVSGLKQLSETKFKNVYESDKNQIKDLWIGLFNDTWKWSDGKGFSFRHWDSNPGDECAIVSGEKMSTDECSNKHHFVCYVDNVILIKENKTWEDALDYCREKHHDLVSVTSRRQQAWVRETSRDATTPFVWMGLRYTCTLDFWFWISDEIVDYKNWALEQADDYDMSGAMETGAGHKWFKKSALLEFNFICLKR